jgi:hypothetical protein
VIHLLFAPVKKNLSLGFHLSTPAKKEKKQRGKEKKTKKEKKRNQRGK